MSSFKGDKYEDFVIEILQNEIGKGKLPFPSDHIIITPKKKYQAHSGNEIEVDIAIEIYRDLTKKPFLIILVECKDYERPIDTMRINDLYTKMGLLSAHKGIIFTTHGCQSGVIKQAEFYNIGIARLNYGDESPKYEVERSNASNEEIYRDLRFNSRWPNSGFIGIVEKCAYTSISNYLLEGILKTDLKPTIKFLTEESIQDCAIKISQKLQVNYDPRLLDIDLFRVLTSLGYTIENFEDERVLGKCDFKNKKVILSKFLDVGSPRWRFTFAHEIGHILLHRKYFSQESLADDVDTLFGGDFLTSANHRRVEIQANCFASYFLMPQKYFIEKYLRAYDFYGIPKRIHPLLYVDDQAVNLKDFNNILTHLSKVFHVSKQTIEIRMRKLNLIKDCRLHQSQSISDLLG